MVEQTLWFSSEGYVMKMPVKSTQTKMMTTEHCSSSNPWINQPEVSQVVACSCYYHHHRCLFIELQSTNQNLKPAWLPKISSNPFLKLKCQLNFHLLMESNSLLHCVYFIEFKTTSSVVGNFHWAPFIQWYPFLWILFPNLMLYTWKNSHLNIFPKCNHQNILPSPYHIESPIWKSNFSREQAFNSLEFNFHHQDNTCICTFQ